MKTRIEILIMLIFTTQIIFAQQPITHNLYTTHNFLLNPAAVGSYGKTSLLLDVYNQWTAFNEAPRIYSLGFETPLNKNSAIGLNIYNDQRSYFNHMIALVNYAYKVKFNADATLSLGLGMGIFNNKLDFANVNPEDKTDPLYNTTDYNKTGFESSVGAMFDYKNLRIGASMPQMLANGMKFQGQYNFLGMYNIKASDKLVVTPSVMVRSFPGFILQEDFNLKGTFDKKYWLQAGYRTDKSILVSAGLNLSALTIGYCYQASGGEITNFAPNSHEIVLGFMLNKKEVVDPNAGKVNMAVNMTDSKTKAPVSGILTLKQNGIPKYTCTGDVGGKCNIMADAGIYNVNVKAKGYVPINEVVDLTTVPKGQVYNYSLTPKKLEKGLEFSMGTINFETNSDKILPESNAALDNMAELLKENPNMVVEVGGHTDNSGTPELNMDLSKKRSDAVMAYLTAKGVDPKQMVPKGYGETKPIASNATEDGKRQNRRVMFTVIDMDKNAYYAAQKPTDKKPDAPKPDPNANKIDLVTKATDAKYKTPVAGNVVLKQNGATKADGKTNNDGTANIYVDPGIYQAEFNANGYIPLVQNVDLSNVAKGSKFNLVFSPVKLEKGLEFDFGSINFETDKDIILPESKLILDHAADVFKQYPKMVIEVGGHTDNQASADYNLGLSQRRTVAAANYLISKGVKKEQLVTKGYGLTKPIADNNTPEGRLKNRRVVFTILSMDADKDPVNVKTFDPNDVKTMIETPENANQVEYVVKAGDNLGAIALKVKVKVEDILKWNNLKTDKIIIGQKLIIHTK